jgi:hypothetical protein
MQNSKPISLKSFNAHHFNRQTSVLLACCGEFQEMISQNNGADTDDFFILFRVESQYLHFPLVSSRTRVVCALLLQSSHFYSLKKDDQLITKFKQKHKRIMASTVSDIDLFCRIERVLHADKSEVDSMLERRHESERSRLARDFPDTFVDAQESPVTVSQTEISEYRHLFAELQSKLCYVNRQQAGVDRDAAFLARERAALERERARIERDKVIAAADLANEELIALRKKYALLKQTYAAERTNWEAERAVLLAKLNIESEAPLKIEAEPIATEPPAKPKRPKAVPRDADHRLDFDFDPGPVLREESRSEGRRLIRYRNGMSATKFKNGTVKMKVKDANYMFYGNGDVAIEFQDGARGYRYAQTGAVELNLPGGTVRYQFPDGQQEIHSPDGEKTIRYPNGERKVIHANGDHELHHPTGRVERWTGGHRIITFESVDAEKCGAQV